MKLNSRQQSFIDCYCISKNATEAYIKAGYATKSEKATGASASRLLGNVSIATEINRRLNVASSKADITIEFILEGIRAIAIKPSAKDNDKLKAYELLGRTKQMFVDKLQIEANVNQSVQVVDDIG